MRLAVVGTGSTGNAYALISDSGEILLLEAGLQFKKVKELINWNIEGIKGMLITHKHGDHFNFIDTFLNNGFDVFCSNGTLEGRKDKYSFKVIEAHKQFSIDRFVIYPFDVRHDVPEPLGFYIYHPECGYILFVTDSYMVDYNFPQVNHFIIEANYCEDKVRELNEQGLLHEYRTERLIKSHMSIQTLVKYIKLHDLSKVSNCILIHLSESNSHQREFENKILSIGGFFNVQSAVNKATYELTNY